MLEFKGNVYLPAAAARAASKAPAPPRGVKIVVPRGQAQTLIGARGVSAYPEFVLRSPTGKLINPADGIQGAVDQGGYRWVTDPTRHGTYVLIAKPTAGTWTLTPTVGSPSIAKVGSALSTPPPRVRTHVKRVRGSYILHWGARRIPHESLRFRETGKYVSRTIRTTTKTSGTVRFRAAAPSAAGARRIQVVVNQNGLPRAVLSGARYLVPKPPRPRQAKTRDCQVCQWESDPHVGPFSGHIKLQDHRFAQRRTALVLPADRPTSRHHDPTRLCARVHRCLNPTGQRRRTNRPDPPNPRQHQETKAPLSDPQPQETSGQLEVPTSPGSGRHGIGLPERSTGATAHKPTDTDRSARPASQARPTPAPRGPQSQLLLDTLNPLISRPNARPPLGTAGLLDAGHVAIERGSSLPCPPSASRPVSAANRRA